MQIVAISDTHNKHDDILYNEYLNEIPDHENSIIFHGGDMTQQGTLNEVIDFLKWYDSLNFKHKVVIAGNHDWIFETSPGIIENILARDFPSIHYLNDSGVTLEGINIWGSPVQPWFHNWAFNRWPDQIKKHWDIIPDNTHIIVTHGPPYLKGDTVRHGEHVGCKFLLERIEEIKPVLSISGHIHEAYGETSNEHTVFFNAAALNIHYEVSNRPLVYNYEKK